MNSKNSVESFTALTYDTMRIDNSSSMDYKVNEIDWQLMTMIDFESSEPDWLSTMMDFEAYIPDWQVPTIMNFELDQTAIKFIINSLIDNPLESSTKCSKDDFAAATTEEPLVNSHHEEIGVASSTKSATDVERVDSDLEMPDGWKSTKDDDAVAGIMEEVLVHSHQDAVELSCDLFHVDAMLKIHFLLSSICLFYTFTNAFLSFFDENQSQVLDLLSSHEELNSIVCKQTKLNIVSSCGIDAVRRIDEVTHQEPIVETIIDPPEILPQVIKTRYGRVVRKPVVYTDLTFSRRQQTCAAVLEPITTTRCGRIIRKPAYYSECGFF